MSCGKPIGHLWEDYQAEVKKGRKPKDVLDKLGLERPCCRAVFITHVDLTKKTGRFKR